MFWREATAAGKEKAIILGNLYVRHASWDLTTNPEGARADI